MATLSNPQSRRVVLAAAFGGLAAALAGALGRPALVAAHDPDDVLLGGDNTATTTTTITNAANGNDVFVVTSNAGGTAVGGVSGSSNGVAGFSTSGAGVFGHSNTFRAVLGTSVGNHGVDGWAKAATGDVRGVFGHSDSTGGTGVYGSATASSGSTIGVRGTAASPKGRGGVFKGGAAQVKLLPSSRTTHPSSGQRGDLFVDTKGRLWYCKGTTNWKQLA
jgi:hypothetical protein